MKCPKKPIAHAPIVHTKKPLVGGGAGPPKKMMLLARSGGAKSGNAFTPIIRSTKCRKYDARVRLKPAIMASICFGDIHLEMVNCAS